MTAYDDAVKAVADSFGAKQNTVEWQTAMLGDGHGTVSTGNNMCYVRLSANSSVIEVLNLRTAMIDGLRVRIAKTPEMPLHWQVIGQDDQRADENGNSGGGANYGTPDHHLDHEYLRFGQVNIDWRQITTLRVYVSTAFTIGVLAGLIPRPGADLVVPTQTLDLTSHIPASGALYVLISVNSVGAIVATDGANIATIASLALGDIPDTPAGNFRLAAVRLYAGQTALSESTTDNDMRDLRWPQERLASSIAPGDMTLTNTHIFVGNASNVAADVAMSNDATLANTGALTLKNTGPGATGPIGSATVVPIVTIDAQGRVTALSSATIAGVTPVGAALTRGSIYRGSAAGAVEALALGGIAGSFLTRDATDVLWSVGALSITANKTLTVSNSMTLAQTLAGGPFTLDLNANLTVKELTAFPQLDINSATLIFSGNFTVGVPASGTIAIGAGTLTSATTNNVTINGHTHAITGSPALLGNGTSQYQTIITGATPFAPVYSGFLLDGTTGGKTVLAVTNAKTLTLTATDTYTFTIPATMTAAGRDVLNTFTQPQTITYALYSVTGLVGLTSISENLYSTGGASGLVFQGRSWGGDAFGMIGFASLNAYGADTTATNIVGAQAQVVFNIFAPRTGTVTNAIGLDVSHPFIADGTVSVFAVRGLHIGDHGTPTGTGTWTVTGNVIGLLLDNQTGAAGRYGIYAGTAVSGSRLGHQLVIDGSTDVSQFTVTGHTTQAVGTALTQFTRNDAAAGVSAMLGLTALGSGANGDGGSILLNGKSSTTTAQSMGSLQWLWVDATHASRKAKLQIKTWDTAERIGLAIEADGAAQDVYFEGGAGSGLPYGSCYGNDIAWSQASAVQNTWYIISDADMADGSGGLNLVAHDGSGKLTVTKAGRYQVSVYASVECSALNKHIQIGIAVNGSVVDCTPHYEVGTPNAQLTLATGSIVVCAASGYIEAAIRTTDTGTPDLAVDHLAIVISQVGG